MVERNLLRDLGVGLVSVVVSFGGGWALQGQQNAAEEQKQERQRALDDQREERARQEAAATKLQEAGAAHARAIEGLWRNPDSVAQRRAAKRLISRHDQRNYRELAEEPSISDDERLALENTLLFFAAVRGWAAAGELDVTMTRQLLGTEPLWWSTTGMPSLLQRWGDAPAPEELVNAALGIAALGGDLPASVSPPLNRAWIDAMLAKAEARMTAPRPVLQASTPQRATITALVAEQLEQDPTTLAMVGHLVGAPEILKSKWLACVEEQAPQSKDAKPVDPGDWYAGLQGAQRRTVDQECPRTTISS